ncbi:hypothetical protein P9222_16160 [Paenibacillus amylolyticus]|nr:hypothetical protein [Paenibacillus amylolyticus]WFR65346.1 hypothetical protein P9222_16160 [Paenibacillus amylolyticus]
MWAVPLTSYEAELLLNKGVNEFDLWIENSDYSILDPCRP